MVIPLYVAVILIHLAQGMEKDSHRTQMNEIGHIY